WWTAHYPDSSPERVRALEVLILSSSIGRATKLGDFAAAAAALRHLVSLAPEEGGDSRAVWAGFLSERIEDRALAGECRAAMDALEVLSIWGDPSGAERRRRMAEFLAPFCAEGSDLSAAYRPFWTEDMALGLPVLRAFEVRRDVDGRVYRFVLPRGIPAGSGEASHFQIALFPRDMHAARTTAAQAEIHRNDIMARTKHLQETGHQAIDLAGLECETYTFVRPAEPGGSDTFVEFYLFQKGPTVYVLTLALDMPRLADLRYFLLVSILHLKVH
ncbi:MAG: hypothetical protein HY720_13235, partial [Planctomycetes bacterium]|nr:hypothetical protein [Planctomycetota bacterium]